MARFFTTAFTTPPVPGTGGILDYDFPVLSDVLDLSKIKIEPGVVSGTQVVSIYRTASRSPSDLQYTTDAFAGAAFVDPADDSGAEFGCTFVIPYHDLDETGLMHFRFINNDANPKAFTVTLDYEYQATDQSGVIGAPEMLNARAVANGLDITSGCISLRNNATIVEAEFRGTLMPAGSDLLPQDMRTVAEGGTWVPDGITKIQATMNAGPGGAQYLFTSGSQARWYYAWRLRNGYGWSRWTDGNATPQAVIQYVDTQPATLADVGPPSSWEVWVEEGPYTGTIVVHASRPKNNGRNLLWWGIQVKDADSGNWVALDSGVAPSQVKYDGSLVSHTLSADRLTLSKAASGWGTAVAGDLVLLDVRGTNFSVNYCQWAKVETVSGNQLIFTTPGFRPQVFVDLRVKIVKSPEAWIGSGYLGDQENAGIWPSGEEASMNGGLGIGWILGDYSTQEFVSTPIAIPSAVTNPEARVWFENIYCRSDDSTHSTGMSGGTGILVSPTSWTDFNNRNLWTPIYPIATWGSMTQEDAGPVVLATGADLTGNQGQVGMKARFRLYPDVTGVIKIYSKWTGVTLPVGIAASNRLGMVIELFDGLTNPKPTTGVCLMVVSTVAGNVHLGSIYNNYRVNIDGGTAYENIVWPPSVGYNNFARPPAGSIVELQLTIAKRSSGVGAKYMRLDIAEVRVGGVGAWTQLVPTYAQEGWHLSQGGLEMFVGLIGNCRLTGTTATLTQVTMVNGIAEIY